MFTKSKGQKKKSSGKAGRRAIVEAESNNKESLGQCIGDSEVENLVQMKSLGKVRVLLGKGRWMGMKNDARDILDSPF